MPNVINKQQQIRGFLLLIASFFVIFSILGGVMYWSYTRTVFRNSDAAITQQIRNFELAGALDNADATERKAPLLLETNTLANVWLYDSHKNLVLDARLPEATKELLSKQFKYTSRFESDTPQTVHIGDNYYRVASVTFIKRAKNNDGHPVKYGVITVNVNDTIYNLNHFKKVILWSFGSFGLLALMVSYWISLKNMKPILRSWQQQQDFVNNAAHELRTPMAVIQGKLENMLTHPESTVREQSDAIILSLSEVRRLTSLTNNMLTLAKSGSNMTRLEKESTDISDFLSQIVAPYQEMAEFDGQQVLLSVRVGQRVMIDQKRIHQLIVLLVDNALKYSEAGDTVSITAMIEKRKLVLTVADTGRGISDEAKKHVFDRFYREDKTGNRETGGTGLGLSIAEWIVHAHGGKIVVLDNQPKGTIFKITLPL
ncbi:sensor histidine kinase [Leuconostoc lactis]|uniref:sensor histidine kinase n=1 Tax=Leuconostoc lactis TaxID=1246 RepID=UPI00101EF0F4|nr:HAMP domain-containing sensor histidine kinase [Leuconostoc lactis]MSB66692.1 sensor histidine kinase [Leuconostoc lactis]RYS88595.1 sensor histidine kinase [Leuconostoc lactis]